MSSLIFAVVWTIYALSMEAQEEIASAILGALRRGPTAENASGSSLGVNFFKNRVFEVDAQVVLSVIP